MTSRLLLLGVVFYSLGCDTSGSPDQQTPFDLYKWDMGGPDTVSDGQLEDSAQPADMKEEQNSDFDVWVAPDSGPVTPTWPPCLQQLDLGKPAVLFSKSCEGSGACACESTDLGKGIAWFLGKTESKADVAVMELQDFSVSKAMVALVNAGKKLRLVVDDTYSNPAEEKAIADVIGAGIEVVDDNRTSAIMHCKYVVMDGKVVLVSSGNFSTYDARSNANNMLYLPSAELAQVFTTHYQGLLAGDFGKPDNPGPHKVTVGGHEVEVFFGPTWKSIDRVVAAIKGAKKSVWFSIYSFTSEEIREAMDSRCGSIQIRGVYDREQDSQDNNSVATGGWCSGAKVYPSKVTGTEGFLKLHHKVLIVDAGEPDAVVIAGSTNWSYSAAEKNDEVMLVLHDPDLARQYEAEFQARWLEAQK